MKLSEGRAAYPLKANKRDLLQHLISGKGYAEIANIYSVSIEAVSRWAERHSNEIEPYKRQLEQASVKYAIADVMHRTKVMDSHLKAIEAYEQENGLAEYERGSKRFAATLAAAKLAVLHEAALQLDQLPRGQSTVSNQTTVIFQEVKGVDPDELV